MSLRKRHLKLSCFDFIVVGLGSLDEIKQNSNGSQSMKTRTVHQNILTGRKYRVLRGGGGREREGIIKGPEIKSSTGA